MMKRLILTLGFLAIAFPAMAAEVIDIQVEGMVCDFCAQSVWKVLEDYEAVEDVDIDLDTQIVSVTLKPGMDLTDEELEKSIHYAGYDFVGLERKTVEDGDESE